MVKMTSKVHDFIKEFNAIERVRGEPVAHPQDTRSTLSLLLTAFQCEVLQVLGDFLLCSYKTTLFTFKRERERESHKASRS